MVSDNGGCSRHVADEPLPIAVAAVLSNWHNVMRAINMASRKSPRGTVRKNEQANEEI